MAHVLVTIEGLPPEEDLAGVARRLGLNVDDLDADYGIVPIDAKGQLRAVLADEVAIRAVAAGLEGVSIHSNPKTSGFSS